MCIILYSKEMVNGFKRAQGNSSGARTEEFCHASYGHDEDSSGPLICPWTDFCATVSNLSSNTQLEEVKLLTYTGWTKYLVKPATIKYKKCRGTIDIGKI